VLRDEAEGGAPAGDVARTGSRVDKDYGGDEVSAKERFEEWLLSVDWTDYEYDECDAPDTLCTASPGGAHYHDPVTAALWSSWQHGQSDARKEFWPPRPVDLPEVWRVKGDEPVMVINQKSPFVVPMFVWELERVEVAK